MLLFYVSTMFITLLKLHLGLCESKNIQGSILALRHG